MSDILSNLLAFVIVLGFLIFAHESGHFLVAKLFRVRVLVFSFGFGKRLFGFRKGDTDYRVSLIPLGGYVRMAGDTPYDRDTGKAGSGEGALTGGEVDLQTGAPDEFLSKPKWQRFLILLAGPGMNLFLAVAILTGVNMIGTQQQILGPVIGEVIAGDPADKAGIKVGDRITAVNGEPVNEFDDFRMAVSMHAATPLRVELVRNGKPMSTTLTPKREEGEFGPVGKAGVRPFTEPIVGQVLPHSPAERAGLKPGDRITAVNGTPVTQYPEFVTLLEKAGQQPLALQIDRKGARIMATLPGAPLATDSYRGFLPPVKLHKLSFVPALEESLQQNWKMLKFAGEALRRLVTAQGSVKELSGPIQIARISGAMFRQGWLPTVLLMAMISLQLGVMNLLPIPVLDGGHIMVLLVEGLVRRDLSLRVKERIQQFGFAVLAALMIVVIYNDIVGQIMRWRNG
jgi:regulator of sigma E protease